MAGLLTLSCVLMVAGFAQAQEAPHRNLDCWNRFRLLAAPAPSEQTPELKQELINYVKSLTPEELLTTAREGCVAGANKPALTLDWEREAAAESNALLCLGLYFDVIGVDEEGRKRLNILTDRFITMGGDKEESLCLRRAIITSLSYSRTTRFHDMLSTYAGANLPKVEVTLSEIIRDKDENAGLRQEAMSALGRVVYAEVRPICRSDSNVREMLKEKRKHSDHAVFVNELVRSGEVTLTEETLNALKPIEARVRAYIKLLGAILADEQNEPEELRKQARRRLEGYRKSALTGIDDDVEEALKQATDSR